MLLLRFLVIMSFAGFAEYQCLKFISTFTNKLPYLLRKIILISFICFTLFGWLGYLYFKTFIPGPVPMRYKNIFIGLFISFTLGKIIIFLIQVINHIIRLLSWLYQLIAKKESSNFTNNSISRTLFIKRTALFMGGLTFLGFTYGIKNRYNYKIKRLKLVFENLPQNFKGLKIVQISDIHTGSFDSYGKVEQGIELALQQKPDIIFFTGDLVNDLTKEVDPTYKAIYSKLKAPMGVFSILGNHDYGDYSGWNNTEDKMKNFEAMLHLQAEMGWTLLLNEHIILEKDNQKIALLGMENWSTKTHFKKYGDMAKTYAGLPEKNIPFKILLSHDPTHWDAEVTKKYKDIDLTLSGHTHGMQCGVDNQIFKFSPVQFIYDKWSGLYQENKQFLYVNTGFGFIGYPGRLGIMPEITVIELA